MIISKNIIPLFNINLKLEHSYYLTAHIMNVTIMLTFHVPSRYVILTRFYLANIESTKAYKAFLIFNIINYLDRFFIKSTNFNDKV